MLSNSTTKKTIYLIRHGETDYNKRGIIQGRGINSDLNDKGKLQARLFYMAYKHIPFDKIYISELNRTYQSVEPFIENNLVYEKLHGLNEINWGVMEGAVPNSLNQLHYHRMIEDWKAGYLDIAIENGETPLQMYTRQKKALDLMMDRETENTILVCMHGRAIRSFLCLLLNEHLSRMENFSHSNLCLYVLEHSGDGKFKISLENSTEHLW
ncbi:MAG: histidine phosphatase family protein [Bacteroidia bacterium]